MPKATFIQDEAWRDHPDLLKAKDDHNVYVLKPGPHVIVYDMATNEEKYVVTADRCPCQAGQYNKRCRHRKFFEAMTEFWTKKGNTWLE